MRLCRLTFGAHDALGAQILRLRRLFLRRLQRSRSTSTRASEWIDNPRPLFRFVREIGRVAVGYRSIRTRALRWIGFSEDDVKTIAEGARFALPEHRAHQKSGGKAAFNFNNALRTTRSLRALNEVDRLLRRRCLLPRAREQGNRITPGDVQVFEKKIQISFKKSVDTISHVQLKRELLPRTTRKNKKSKKSKKSIDIILALLLQAMLPAPLPGPKFYPHQP